MNKTLDHLDTNTIMKLDVYAILVVPNRFSVRHDHLAWVLHHDTFAKHANDCLLVTLGPTIVHEIACQGIKEEMPCSGYQTHAIVNCWIRQRRVIDKLVMIILQLDAMGCVARLVLDMTHIQGCILVCVRELLGKIMRHVIRRMRNDTFYGHFRQTPKRNDSNVIMSTLRSLPIHLAMAILCYTWKMLKMCEGDLVDMAQRGAFDVIVHGCNCFCTMSRGIAHVIAKAFPEALRVDQQTTKGDMAKLGTCTVAHEGTVDVVNAYTQYHYRGRHNIDYQALRSCMRDVARRYHGKRIGMPKIGAGLAGGDWNTIRRILEEELGTEDVTVVVLPTNRRVKSIR